MALRQKSCGYKVMATYLSIGVGSVEGGGLGAVVGARVCEAAGVAQGAGGLGVRVQGKVVKLKNIRAVF
jgi:hypothetical protein